MKLLWYILALAILGGWQIFMAIFLDVPKEVAFYNSVAMAVYGFCMAAYSEWK